MKINPNSVAMTYYDWEEVKLPITTDQLDEWLINLSSGKFKQATGKLNISNKEFCGYCCLGVLAHQLGTLDVVFDKHSDYLYVEELLDLEDDLSRFFHYLPERLQTLIGEVNDANDSFDMSIQVITALFTSTRADLLEKYGTDFNHTWAADWLEVLTRQDE